MSSGKLAVLLLVPALTFATGALARGHGDQRSDRHDRQVHDQRASGSDHYRLRARAVEQDNAQDDHRRQPPERRMDPPIEHIRGGRDGGGYHGSGGDRGGDRGQGRDRGDRGRRDDRNHWHGERREWHGQTYWHANIRLFPRYDWDTWRGGHWYHGWYGQRWGWWWLAGNAWFYYPVPIYPYPNPYVPGRVTVVNTEPPAPAAPAQAPVAQYWYHCKAPDGYYPYVPHCPSGWSKVPVTPPGASQSANAPPAATHQKGE
ncbi:MAG: hypothetical protein WCB49_04240 [Gammaproteobacteria bacterium]